MATSYSPKIVTDGLVLCLDAGDGKSYGGSGTTWTDRSGNGNNGTLVNGVGYNSANGGSLVFDGVNDYVNCGNILNYTTQSFTFNSWFYISSFTTSSLNQGPILFYKGSFNSNGYYCQIDSSGSIKFITNQSGAYQVSGASSGSVSLNEWYFVSFVRTGSNVTIYLNGIQASSSNSHINPASSSSNFILAAYNSSNPFIFSNLRISQFSSHNKALSPQEVLQNYNATKGRFGI